MVALRLAYSIGRECAWQNGAVSEQTFHWLIEDVGELVFEALRRD